MRWWHYVAFVFGLLLGVVFILRRIIRMLRTAVAEAMDRALAGRAPVVRQDWVGYLGKRPAKGGTLRGNGAIALTKDELIFLMAAPRREVRIPLAAIRDVRLPKSFAGRSVFRPLLVVKYATDEGEFERGWVVPDAAKWADAIRGLCGIEG